RRRRLSVPVSVGFGSFGLIGLSGVIVGMSLAERLFAALLLLVGVGFAARAWRMATVVASDDAISVRGLWGMRRFTRPDLRNFQVVPKVGGFERSGFALAAVLTDGSVS